AGVGRAAAGEKNGIGDDIRRTGRASHHALAVEGEERGCEALQAGVDRRVAAQLAGAPGIENYRHVYGAAIKGRRGSLQVDLPGVDIGDRHAHSRDLYSHASEVAREAAILKFAQRGKARAAGGVEP